MDQEIVLTIPGRYDQIREITRFVIAGGKSAGLDEDAIFHVELCCDEAASNIIEHAYGGEDKGDIRVCYVTSDSAFTITMVDHGRPFNPNNVPEPKSINTQTNTPDKTLTDYLDSLQVGGLGIYFMRKLMDEVHYRHSPDEGNELTLVKYLPTENIQ